MNRASNPLERHRISDVIHIRERFHEIICPFLSTLVNEGVLDVKAEYTKDELLNITKQAGLDPAAAEQHIAGNFKNNPSMRQDIFKMEGAANEHIQSLSINDCPTSFTNCSVDTAGIAQCETHTSDCDKPNTHGFEEFWVVVDVNKDGIMTRRELSDAVEKRLLRIVDANPIGEGTIVGSYGFLIDIFGENENHISRLTLKRVLLERKFPLHYNFHRADLVMDILDANPGEAKREIKHMWIDRSGNGNDVVPGNIHFDGVNLKLSGQVLTVRNSNTLNFGDRSFTVSGWLNPNKIAHPASSFVMKKAHDMYFAAGSNGVLSAGWELGHGFVDNGIRLTARGIDAGRCSGILKFDADKAWSDMLNQWTHIAVVFDRAIGQAILYLNGHRQQEPTLLSNCSGSWDNNHALEIGGTSEGYEWLDLKGHDTWQSSTNHYGYPSRAVDGSKSSHWNSRSCTHTAQSYRPWWKVDLGKDHHIQKIVVRNRADCCGEALNNFDVLVDGEKCADGPAVAETINEVVCNAKGSVLEVQAPNLLMICEVEVFATPFSKFWSMFGLLRFFKVFNGVARPSQIRDLAMQNSFHSQQPL